MPGLDRDLSAQSSAGHRSETTSLFDESGHSSIFTDDGSDEGKAPRPTLSPHQSHAGLLTLSSPEFHTQAQPVATAEPPEPSPGTVPTNNPLANIPHIVEPSKTSSQPTPAIPDRSISPVGKLKSAFTLPRKQAGDGDTESVKSASSGAAGLGGIFRPRSRRTSLSSQSPEDTSKNRGSASETSLPAPNAEDSEVRSTAVDARPETPKQRNRGRINTESLPATPPNLVDAPITVTPPTPTHPSAEFPRKAATFAPAAPPPINRPLSSIESIKHRRAQSASIPSRLSTSVLAPLTPTVEELKTPGGTLTQPASATGFFSSFISATQKAADQLSNNINTAIGTQTKGKPSIPEPVGVLSEEVIPGTESRPGISESEKRQLAVDTLGKGELSFSHLGISDDTDTIPMVSAVDLPQRGPLAQNGQASNKVEEAAAARAVSAAYEKPVQSLVSQATGRPISSASQDRSTLGEQSPPPGADAEGIKRSGSIRSKISGRRRKHRASSATTGTAGTGYTIAAAMQSSASILAPASTNTNGPGHRLTGFAVASVKRNKDFHQQFRSVPEDDYLIEDYSAALQRDILLHGRLYVSEAHICFSSNILGWVTNLVISFDEMVSVEKKSTAMIFPNAIVIQTLQARNTFASLVARDSTYDLLIGIWKISHPNLKSSLNGVLVEDAAAGDKTEVADPDGSEADSIDDGSDDDVYDEDDDDMGSFDDGVMAPSIAGSELGEAPLSRKTSTVPLGIASQTNGVAKGLEGSDAVVTGAAVSADFPGPQAHAPTECGESGEHYDRPLPEALIPAPLGKVYSIMWGPASNAFMRKWLVEDQKSRELNLAEDKFGLDNDHKSMTFDYIKPLNAPVGPRQTKCITTSTLMSFDLEKAITIDCSTQTPDVPSGSIFTVKTRYCLMWGPGNSTKIVANCTIEWTGKSWLRGPIEKGANDGQIEYFKALAVALKAAVTTKPPVKGVLRKGKRKGKREVFDAEVADAAREAAVAVEHKPATWGVLEPLHQILEPFISILRPFITHQVIIAVLLALLTYNWLVAPSRAGAQVGFPGSQRLAAYEEMWRREESELWDWLEDRVGLDHLYAPASVAQKGKQRAASAKGVAKTLEDERMSQRQMDDAVRVTEERLATLKEAVAKKKEEGGAKRAKQAKQDL
ncbi:hypothetical protein LTR08_005173 [Meristemomyces frigidus]|nr:hypothetical protein LTR08_005173 [Meristemomyces frigidus]